MPDISTLTNFTLHLAAILYLAAAACQLLIPTLEKQITRIGVAGFLLHLIGLLLTNTVSTSFYDALSVTALIVVVATLAVQWKHPTKIVLVPLYSLTALFIFLSIYLGHRHPIEAPTYGMWLHILSSISAYALLCAASLYSVLLLFTEKRLRSHHHLWSEALPPLQLTEKTLFSLLASGWVLLTIAIVSGLAVFDNLFAQQLLHKTAFSILSWLLFSVLLAGRYLYGWRGKTAAHWTLGSFITLMLAYMGSKFVLDVILHEL